MIKLSEMIFDLEMENTTLNLDEIVEKTTEEDPVFVDRIIHGALERMASKAWGNTISNILENDFRIAVKNQRLKDSTQMYIKYEDAMQVISEALFQYHYIMEVQDEVEDLENGAREDGAIE